MYQAMLSKKREHPKEKSGLHPRNRHRERYDFPLLIGSCPELADYVHLNKFNDESIDFSDSAAVLTLNKALLKYYYGVEHWNIPVGFLCPPIPGRADYIHLIADLLGSLNNGIVPVGSKIKCLDIGVGANCIYPIIGHKEYGWYFVGADIEPIAIESATKIIDENTFLKGNVELRLQANASDIFKGIIQKAEQFEISICNPPFHASFEEAQAGTLRKLSNLRKEKVTKATLNFGGQNRELYCEGGEEKFVQKMILQSKEFSNSCLWFSTLISKAEYLKAAYSVLKSVAAVEVRTIPMTQGNKISRILAWTFQSKVQQNKWLEKK
jgi:23S rRNA (adenine1618-N6)-methyltransferase